MVIAVRTERRRGGLEVVKHADTDAERLRLQTEAQLLARAAHPGVVEVVEAGGSILRLRHGGTALAQLGPLAPDHAAAIVRRVASTVGDLHRTGVTHGRIDPTHVVVDAEGRPRLCGFAAANDADDGGCADDVAALGHLLGGLLDASPGALWSPPLRGIRAAGRRTRALRGFRAAIAAATDDDPERRPSAAQFAAAIHTALPELTLPVAGGHAADAGPSEIPAGVDPTAELAWTDSDLSFLAAADEGDDDTWARGASEDAPAAVADDPAPIRTPQPPRIEIRPPAAATTTPPRRGMSRAGLALVAAVVLVIGVVAGSAAARAIRPFGGADPRADRATPTSVPIDTTAPGEGDPADVLRPPSFAEGCTVPAAPGPDADGDGCPDPVELDGRVATVGNVRVELGTEGDLVAVGDPDCDGVVTPAVLRPSSGEVFVFEGWSLSDVVEIEATAVIVDATAIAGASCEPFVVTDVDGREAEVGAGPT